jgi:hypothetical protein
MEDGQAHSEQGRIDRAIDSAVREMLDVEPLPGMRGRVLQRIQTEDPTFFGRKLLWAALPLAAAAVVILSVLLPRQREQQPAPVATAVNTQPQNPAVAPPPPSTAPRAPRTTPAIEPRPAVVAQRVPRPASAATARPDRVVAAAASFTASEPADGGIAPLEAIAPIEVAPVAPRALAQADIAMRPLTPITELVIAPLTPPGRH